MTEKMKELKAIDSKWSWVGALSDTANGNIAGKEKIMLETFVQTAYFTTESYPEPMYASWS